MKSRRKVELAIEDLKRFAAGSNRDDGRYNGYRLIRNLYRFMDQLASDPANLRELLKGAALLSASRGPGQGRTEEELFKELATLAADCGEKLGEHALPISETAELLPETARPRWEALQALAQFAVWCLAFRKPRDSFGGRRRVTAFEILSHAAPFMNLPDAVALAQELEKSNRDDGDAARDFLMSYNEARGTPDNTEDSPNVVQLKITLRDIHPPIWRRILVPDDLLLGDLHYIVNRSMGWENYHMHAFRFGRIEYAGAETVAECGPPIRDEDSVTLAALIRRKGQAFEYEYDFGDSWEHDIEVEAILPFDPNQPLPHCLAGERACPPEDCGGFSGYNHALEVLRNPGKFKEQGFREWLGNFDPEKFDLEETNKKLR